MKEIEKYSIYLESEDEFSYTLRMEYEWHDEKYQELIHLIKNACAEYKDSDVFPKSLIYFFTSEIDLIIGIITNSNFVKTIPSNYTEEGYIKMLNTRKAQLLELKRLFFAGNYHAL